MADNMGVLGGVAIVTVGTHTAYTCPANKAAKFRLYGKWRAGPASAVSIQVGGVIVLSTGALTDTHFIFTNGGAGLIRAAAVGQPSGVSAAETAQPAPPIYYLSPGGAVTYTIQTADCTVAQLYAVGVEVDLTP